MSRILIAQRRARRGARLMDMRRPGWASKINLDRLNISNPYACVFHKVYGSYIAGCCDLGLDTCHKIAYGFLVTVTFRLFADTRRLNQAWMKEIEKRLDLQLRQVA